MPQRGNVADHSLWRAVNGIIQCKIIRCGFNGSFVRLEYMESVSQQNTKLIKYFNT